MGCIRYIYKQNERHIVSILLMVEIGDFGFRIKQKRFLYVCPVFSSDQDNAKITFLFNMTLCNVFVQYDALFDEYYFFKGK